MKVITAIYLNCRPELRDEWLTTIDVDNDLDESMVSTAETFPRLDIDLTVILSHTSRLCGHWYTFSIQSTMLLSHRISIDVCRHTQLAMLPHSTAIIRRHNMVVMSRATPRTPHQDSRRHLRYRRLHPMVTSTRSLIARVSHQLDLFRCLQEKIIIARAISRTL